LLFFTEERVIAGLKNARAKGKIIGRVRKRNDVLIHSLLESGMSFRTISKIAKCSHGSVSASKLEWLAKKAQLSKEIPLLSGSVNPPDETSSSK
jgi:DNA invertase Pin-like site-specific DNA recombinase